MAEGGDLLQLNNQLKRAGVESVANESPFSRWGVGQISGLPGAVMKKDALPDAAPMARVETKAETDEVLSETAAVELLPLEVLYTKAGDPTTIMVTAREPFTLRSFLQALKNQAGVDSRVREEQKKFLDRTFRLRFSKTPIKTVLRWLSDAMGRPIELRNQNIEI